jgi:hypothetical protein
VDPSGSNHLNSDILVDEADHYWGSMEYGWIYRQFHPKTSVIEVSARNAASQKFSFVVSIVYGETQKKESRHPREILFVKHLDPRRAIPRKYESSGKIHLEVHGTRGRHHLEGRGMHIKKQGALSSFSSVRKSSLQRQATKEDRKCKRSFLSIASTHRMNIAGNKGKAHRGSFLSSSFDVWIT